MYIYIYVCVSFVNHDLINNGVIDIYTLYYPCFSANHQRLGTFAFATARDGVTWRYGDFSTSRGSMGENITGGVVTTGKIDMFCLFTST